MSDRRRFTSSIGSLRTLALSGVAAAVWSVIVLVWPRLPLDDTDTGRGWQASVDGTIAAIMAAVVVLLLTVGLAAIQLLSSFSWRATRLIVDRSSAVGVMMATVLGVAWPLAVAADPHATQTRWVFVGFGWALVLLALLGATAVRRIAPYALVDRVIAAALTEVTQAPRRVLSSEKTLAARAEVLVELLGSTGLADADRRRVGITTALVISTYARLGFTELGHLRLIDDLVAVGGNMTDPTRLSDLVGVLGGIGMDLAADWGDHRRIANALRDIAGRARIAAHRDVGRQALDALADLASVRFEHLLAPDVTLDDHGPAGETREPRSATQHDAQDAMSPSPATASGDDGPPSVATTSDEQRQKPTGRASQRSSGYLGYFEVRVKLISLSRQDLVQTVNEQAEAAPLAPLAVAAMLANLGKLTGRGTAVHTTTRTGRTQAQQLMDDTVTTLTTCLAAPYADSSGWPVGWQGSEAFAQDIERITALASALYQTHRYVSTDTVERTLEDIAQRVAEEWRPRRKSPPDGTGWRHTVNPVPEPAVVVVQALCRLMKDAFGAGFDRHALITGRRLLALTAGAAQDSHLAAVDADSDALIGALSNLPAQCPGDAAAVQERQYTILDGLIAEFDPLLAAGLDAGLRQSH
jgi:hypothetical protein